MAFDRDMPKVVTESDARGIAQNREVAAGLNIRPPKRAADIHERVARFRPSALTVFLSANGGATRVWTLPISATNWTWKTLGTMRPFSALTRALNVSGREGGSEIDSFMLMKVP